MPEIIALYFKPIKIIVFVTFALAWLFLNKKSNVNRYLLGILFTCFMVELTVPLMMLYDKQYAIAQNLGGIVHTMLWLYLLAEIMGIKKVLPALLLSFLGFAMLNAFFGEGTYHFNYFTFIAGALLYISVFSIRNSYFLKQEEITMFLSNGFLLAFAPVIFFFGVSFIFAFRNRAITEVPITANMDLWEFVIHYCNIIYYLLVNLYIYRESRTKFTR